MSFGTTSQIINADRLKVIRVTTEVTLTSDAKIRKTRPVDRVNTRAGPVDSFRWKLEEIEFTAALTELLLTQLQTDSTMDSFSNLPYNNWKINGISISGTVGDNTDDTVSATLLDYEQVGPENGIAQIRIKLRVTGSTT